VTYDASVNLKAPVCASPDAPTDSQRRLTNAALIAECGRFEQTLEGLDDRVQRARDDALEGRPEVRQGDGDRRVRREPAVAGDRLRLLHDEEGPARQQARVVQGLVMVFEQAALGKRCR